MREPRSLPLAWRLAWAIPVLGAVVGLVLAIPALLTDDVTLAADPCASSWENPYARAAQIAFWIGLGGSVLLVARAILARDRHGLVASVAALCVGVIVMLAGMLFASAGYGWHCPDY